jgi:PD-(D/E)XK endonuclease
VGDANVRSSGTRRNVLPVDTIARGNAAEGAVLQALVEAGVGVLIPFGSGLSFDLGAVMPGGTILRVQVKCGRVRNRCVMFNAASTDHGRDRGRADVLAVHVASLSRVFMVPVDDCPAYVGVLRLDAPRNNQRRGVRFAEEYGLERWLESHLPVRRVA